jgi:hypothetical protein
MIQSTSKPTSNKIEIDCHGPEGNAFAVMGTISRLAKQSGDDPDPILNEMRSGNYHNLITVADKYYGRFINFYNAPEE